MPLWPGVTLPARLSSRYTLQLHAHRYMLPYHVHIRTHTSPIYLCMCYLTVTHMYITQPHAHTGTCAHEPYTCASYRQAHTHTCHSHVCTRVHHTCFRPQIHPHTYAHIACTTCTYTLTHAHTVLIFFYRYCGQLAGRLVNTGLLATGQMGEVLEQVKCRSSVRSTAVLRGE